MILKKISKNYDDVINEISNDEIKMIVGFLDGKEKKEYLTYKKNINKNITRKGEYYFLCYLLDRKEVINKITGF